MSILASAKKASELTLENWIKALLLGKSKTGKTEGSVTLPLVEEKPILHLALTPRTRATLAGYPHVEILEIIEQQLETKKLVTGVQHNIVSEAWDKIYTVLTELWDIANSGKPFPYSGVVLDDSSTLNRYCMNFVLGLKTKKDGKIKETEKGIGGAPKWETHFVPHTMEMTKILAGLLIPLPCHIVVCGHYDVYTDDDTKLTLCQPAVYSRALRSVMPSWFNEVYETTAKHDPKEGRERYFWTTFGSGQKDFLGSTMNKQNKIWKSPFEVELDQKPAGFAKLAQLVAEAKK